MSDAKIKILLVEDNPADAVLIKEFITASETGTYELQWVDRLTASFKLLEEIKVEAILLDLGLPDSNGLPTFEKIFEKFPQVPIIILTGFSDSNLATLAVRAGAQDYLVKGLVDSHALQRSINYAIERKRAQEVLLETQRTLETLMKNLPGMAYRRRNDRQLTMMFVSEGVVNLTGHHPSDFTANKSLSYNSLIHTEDRERVWTEIQTALNTNVPYRLIYRIYSKENQLKWVWEQGCGIYDENKSLRALEGLVIDISEQIEYQNKLRKLSAAVGQAANIICITDTEGIIEYVNPAFVKVSGFSFKEVYGAELRNVKIVVDNERYYRNIRIKTENGETWTDKIQVRKKNGEWYWEQVNVSPIFDDNRKVTNILFVGNDITSEVNTHQKLVEADKMSAIGLLAAGVAHEFKNYLGGIIGYASYAQSCLDSKDAPTIIKDTLTQIVEIGERANEVAMSLLTYSKVKSDVLTRQDLKSSIEKTLELFSKELKNSCIQVETHFENVPTVRISPGRIQQVILNLLINARDAIEKHGKIGISIARDGDNVCVKVSDNGAGISEENIRKVFDPFYSTKGVWGKDEIVGTGMGLSVSRNIAREHGGDLTVESEPGRGTTFMLSLPVSDDGNETGKLETGLNTNSPECKAIALISMSSELIQKCGKDAGRSGCTVTAADSFESFQKIVESGVDIVLADALFAAKVELFRMLESCRAKAVPFVMINCGAKEYQLNDLYESALAVYRDCPEIKRIIMQYRSLSDPQKQIK